MRRMTKALVFLWIGILTAGCVSAPPSAVELALADYGSPISQQQAQALAREFLTGRLKDPESAQYQWGNVHQGWLRHAAIHGGGIVYGYLLDVQVNAKNSFGGYVGYKPYRFLFRNGSIETVYGQQELSPGNVYMGKLY